MTEKFPLSQLSIRIIFQKYVEPLLKKYPGIDKISQEINKKLAELTADTLIKHTLEQIKCVVIVETFNNETPFYGKGMDRLEENDAYLDMCFVSEVSPFKRVFHIYAFPI